MQRYTLASPGCTLLLIVALLHLGCDGVLQVSRQKLTSKVTSRASIGINQLPAAPSPMASAIPAPATLGPTGLALVPDFDKLQWTWVVDPPPSVGLAPGPAASAPSPLASSAPAPGPAAPAVANPCNALLDLGKTGAPGQFLGCQEFRYYGVSLIGAGQPYGCNCGAWSVNCPFQTCDIGQAWDEQCLDPAATSLGFTGLSRNWHPLPSGSLPMPMTGFVHHPGIFSMCMYWLPKPQNPTLPPMDVAGLSMVLPRYANLMFQGAALNDCMKAMTNSATLEMTKQGLKDALGIPDISVVTVDCGSFNALIQGPPSSVEQAVAKATAPNFCFDVSALQVHICTAPLAGPAPSPAGGFASAPFR